MSYIKMFLVVVAAVALVLGGFLFWQRAQYSAYEQAAVVAGDLNVVSQARIMVAEYFSTHGKMPASNADLGLNKPRDIRGHSLRSLEVSEGGVITATFDSKSGVDGGTLRFEPVAVGGSFNFRWECQTSSYKNLGTLCHTGP